MKEEFKKWFYQWKEEMLGIAFVFYIIICIWVMMRWLEVQ